LEITIDFVSFDKRTFIELNGGQHASKRSEDIKANMYFDENEFMVLRFWNHEVLENSDGVLEVIKRKVIP